MSSEDITTAIRIRSKGWLRKTEPEVVKHYKFNLILILHHVICNITKNHLKVPCFSQENLYIIFKKKKYSVGLVRTRTIPTKQPQPADEVFFFFLFSEWGVESIRKSTRHRGHFLTYCACPG
jgi:hypothetical protein